jgi:hypothetical protein
MSFWFPPSKFIIQRQAEGLKADKIALIGLHYTPGSLEADDGQAIVTCSVIQAGPKENDVSITEIRLFTRKDS